MEPLEIKIALMRAEIRQADIARACQVSTAAIARVINGQATSDRIQRMIAKALGQRVEAVFPERYPGKRRADRVLEQLVG